MSAYTSRVPPIATDAGGAGGAGGRPPLLSTTEDTASGGGSAKRARHGPSGESGEIGGAGESMAKSDTLDSNSVRGACVFVRVCVYVCVCACVYTSCVCVIHELTPSLSSLSIFIPSSSHLYPIFIPSSSHLPGVRPRLNLCKGAVLGAGQRAGPRALYHTLYRALCWGRGRGCMCDVNRESFHARTRMYV